MIRRTATALRTATLAVLMLLVVTATSSGCIQVDGDKSDRNEHARRITLGIAANSLRGGKDSAGAAWIEDWVIPRFVAAQAKKGVTATVTFRGSGTDDQEYRARAQRELSGNRADIVELDGIWVGGFARRDLIEPLDSIVSRRSVDAWSGWSQIPESVQLNGQFEGRRYGIPTGTDGRVLYFNKKLFARANLPADWQPRSWAELLAAGRALKALPGVTPIQLDAGTAMGEASTMQGFLPLLAGVGQEIYQDGRWQGDTPAVRRVLDLYRKIYRTEGLGDPSLQQQPGGRERSFAEFAAGRIGILAESDYFWRDVIHPRAGTAPMPDRNRTVGWAHIPSRTPAAGVGDQDFVSLSGGGLRVINPNTRYPKQAWELLRFMNSAAAVRAGLSAVPRITQREDVNSRVLARDPHLRFIAQQVLPLTRFRPPLAEYTAVSAAIQRATAQVVAGRRTDEAARAYSRALAEAVHDPGAVADEP